MNAKLLVALVAILNLVAGLSLGFALGRSHAVERHVYHPLPTGEDVDIPRLADVLALPPEKDARVRSILATFRPRCDEIMKDVRPKLESLHRDLVAELGSVITEPQMEELAREFHRQLEQKRREPQ